MNQSHSETTQPNALEVSHLTMRFGPVTALDDVSISINPGEIHGIVGHNGSGKSTLVEILAGTYAPTNGALSLFGSPTPFPAQSRDSSRFPVAVVHQDVGLVGSMSVVDNFRVNRFTTTAFGTLNWRSEKRLTRQRLESLGLEIDPDILVERLSVADQVLIAVARALLDLEEIRKRSEGKDQEILILDEPTSSLPSGTVDSFLSTISEINRNFSTTVIIISHNPREIMSLSHRFTALKNGKVVGTYITGQVDYTELAELMAGQEIKHNADKRVEFSSRSEKGGREVLKVENLIAQRIKGVDFTINTGEVVGITGLLGSGHEDIPYILCGSSPKEGGSIYFLGNKMEKLSPQRFRQMGGMLLPGDRKLTSGVPLATVRENMTMGYLDPYLKGRVLSKKSEHRSVSNMLERLRIRPKDPDRTLATFSGGQQQKILVARCILRSAPLVIIDEPSTGIDVGARDEIHATLREMAKDDTAVVVVSSQYEELPMVCDRVLVFQNGIISGELTGDQVSEEAILKLCYMDIESKVS